MKCCYSYIPYTMAENKWVKPWGGVIIPILLAAHVDSAIGLPNHVPYDSSWFTQKKIKDRHVQLTPVLLTPQLRTCKVLLVSSAKVTNARSSDKAHTSMWFVLSVVRTGGFSVGCQIEGMLRIVGLNFWMSCEFWVESNLGKTKKTKS